MPLDYVKMRAEVSCSWDFGWLRKSWTNWQTDTQDSGFIYIYDVLSAEWIYFELNHKLTKLMWLHSKYCLKKLKLPINTLIWLINQHFFLISLRPSLILLMKMAFIYFEKLVYYANRDDKHNSKLQRKRKKTTCT